MDFQRPYRSSFEYIGGVPGNQLHQDGLKLVELEQPRFTDHGYAFVTGQAYNSASDLPGQPEEFHVAGPANNYRSTPAKPIQGGFSGSAKFVFVTEDGCINTWSANTEEDGLFGRLNARKGQIPKS